MDRKANAKWRGDLRAGSGSIRLGSGMFEGPYSFKTRFEAAPGTNPEELLGAAHAGCFSMALALGLTKAGHPPRSIETSAVVHLNKVGEGFGITGIDLGTRGEVPGLSEGEFQRLANEAKVNCIISKALADFPVSLTATLISS
jgi:osmotically inducible protein OsmC